MYIFILLHKELHFPKQRILLVVVLEMTNNIAFDYIAFDSLKQNKEFHYFNFLHF